MISKDRYGIRKQLGLALRRGPKSDLRIEELRPVGRVNDRRRAAAPGDARCRIDRTGTAKPKVDGKRRLLIPAKNKAVADSTRHQHVPARTGRLGVGHRSALPRNRRVLRLECVLFRGSTAAGRDDAIVAEIEHQYPAEFIDVAGHRVLNRRVMSLKPLFGGLILAVCPVLIVLDHRLVIDRVLIAGDDAPKS